MRRSRAEHFHAVDVLFRFRSKHDGEVHKVRIYEGDDSYTRAEYRGKVFRWGGYKHSQPSVKKAKQAMVRYCDIAAGRETSQEMR